MALSQFKESFDKTYQEVLFARPVALKVAKADVYDVYEMGQSVKRPITNLRNEAILQTVVDDQDLLITSPTDTGETLTINNHKALTSSVRVKEEALRRDSTLGAKQGVILGGMMANYLDSIVLGETLNAHRTVKASDFGAGVGGVDLTAANTAEVYSRAMAYLEGNDVDLMGNGIIVTDALGAADLRNAGMARETALGDRIFQNYKVGQFGDFTVHQSNRLPASFEVTVVTVPTAAQTLSVGGVTWTFVTTATNPGEIKIEATVTAQAATIVAALTGAAPVSGNHVLWAAGSAEARKVREMYVTASNAAGVVTGVTRGTGRLGIVTDGTRITIGHDTVNTYVGKAGAIDLALPRNAELLTTQEPRQLRTNLIMDILFGVKTFTDGSQYFLNLQLKA